MIVALVLSFCASQILVEHLEKNPGDEKKAAKHLATICFVIYCLPCGSSVNNCNNHNDCSIRF